MHKYQRGMTLIELMIVIAIIGILASIAIPSYQDYLARSQAAEAVSLMSGGKTPLVEYRSERGNWPSAAGEVMTTIRGRYVSNITISSGAGLTQANLELTATMRSTNVSRLIQGRTINLSSPDGGLTWNCSAGTIDVKFLAAVCR